LLSIYPKSISQQLILLLGWGFQLKTV
jgi:hypothetical protein